MDPFSCPHCQQSIVQSREERLKVPTSMLIIHKSGAIEINCPRCKLGVFVPLTLSDGAFELRKAGPRHVISRLTSPPDKRQE